VRLKFGVQAGVSSHGETLVKNIIMILIVLIASVATALGECSVSDRSNLEAFDRAWGKAGDSGDKASLEALYADEYQGIPDMSGKADTVANAMRAYEAGKADPSSIDKVLHDHYVITCTPASATITHRNVIDTKSGNLGVPQIIWTRSVHFLEKRNGKWQVVSNATHLMDDYMYLAYMEQDWNDANQNRDKAWFERNYAPDYISVSSETGKLANKADDIASSLNSKSTNELTETKGLNVRIDRQFATVTGVYRYKGKDEKGVAYDHKIRFIDTFVRRDGRWMVWASSGSEIK